MLADKLAPNNHSLTVFFGLGTYGFSVAHLLKRQKDQGRTTILSLLKAEPQRKKGILIQNRENISYVWLPRPKKTLLATTVLWRYLLKIQKAEIVKLAKKTVAKAAAAGKPFTSINLCLAGSLAEEEGVVLAAELAGIIQYLSKLLGQSVFKVAFLFLPESVSLPKALTTASSSFSSPDPASYNYQKGVPSFDITFLLSNIVSGGLIAEQQTVQLISEFMDILKEPKLQLELKERFSSLSEKVATFTLATLVYPVKQLKEKQIRAVVKQIIAETVINPDSSSFAFLADEFSAEENINLDSLLYELKQAVGQFTPAYLLLEAYPEKNKAVWLPRLTQYQTFLFQSVLPKAQGALKEKAEAIFIEWEQKLKQKLDELLQTPFGFKQAEDFLAALEQQLAKMKQTVLSQVKEPPAIDKKIKQLKVKLKEKILNFPDVEAVVLRLSAFFLLFIFGGRQVIIELRQLPPHFINPQFLPSADFAYLGGLVLVAIGWLSYKLQELRLFRTKDAIANLLEQHYQELLDKEAKAILICLLSKDAALQSKFRFRGTFLTVLGEYDEKIKKLKRAYVKLYQTLERNPIVLKESAVKHYLIPEANISYKLGHYHPAQEFELFLAAGGHRDWAALNSRKLYSRWHNYCSQGLKFYDQLTADEIFSSLPPEMQLNLLEKLRKSAYFYLRTSSGWPNLTEILLINTAQQKQPFLPKHLTVIPSALDKIVYLKLSYPLSFA